MPFHQPAIIKQWIKDLLLTQEKLFLAGGYHQQSEVYYEYQLKLGHLLHIYDLPNSPEVICRVLDYPLTPVGDITNQCNDCPQMFKMVFESYKEAVVTGIVEQRFVRSRMWMMKAQVEAIYFNLILMSESGYPEIR